jgi:hypothetical protein
MTRGRSFDSLGSCMHLFRDAVRTLNPAEGRLTESFVRRRPHKASRPSGNLLALSQLPYSLLKDESSRVSPMVRAAPPSSGRKGDSGKRRVKIGSSFPLPMHLRKYAGPGGWKSKPKSFGSWEKVVAQRCAAVFCVYPYATVRNSRPDRELLKTARIVRSRKRRQTRSSSPKKTRPSGKPRGSLIQRCRAAAITKSKASGGLSKKLERLYEAGLLERKAVRPATPRFIRSWSKRHGNVHVETWLEREFRLKDQREEEERQRYLSYRPGASTRMITTGW